MPSVLHDLVAESATRDADALALVDGDRSITYGELVDLAGRVARLLIHDCGVRRGDRVGVHAEKSIETIVAIYGAMMAGAAYVPLDASAPAARIAFILGNCDIRVLVSPTKLKKTWTALPESGAHLDHVVALDADSTFERPEAMPTAITLHRSAPPGDATAGEATADMSRDLPTVIDDDLAYILYTSGSTGDPKGVMVSHRNAMAFATWAADEFALTADDRVAQLAPLIFDLSTFDLFASACAGASVHLVGRKAAMFPADLRTFIDDNEISTIYAVPSMLTMLVERGGLSEGALPSLRRILFAGEVFPTRHLAALMQLISHPEYANLYGPTETNVCTFHRVLEVPAPDDPPSSIGIAITNDEAIVVGDDGQVVEPGETGELFIRGATVMQGYWGDPERSAKVLVPPPGSVGGREPAYRTGDLVRAADDGALTFLGRRDNQVKRRGYRIELGDIEAAILADERVVECAVSGLPDDELGTRLVAHVVSRAALEPKDVLKFSQQHIPRYMVPDHVEFLSALPKTSTDKIDRAGLRRRAHEEHSVDGS
ncbi:MAG: amino acid adenylation domain-containing protein [Acidimicrobiia bacterium]|nr:amino acid adenylation domain-containing protein [Acidimicrobiia bacterium]